MIVDYFQYCHLLFIVLEQKSHVTLHFCPYGPLNKCLSCVPLLKIHEKVWVFCVSVTCEYYMGTGHIYIYIYIMMMSQEASPLFSSVPSRPLPPFRGRKVMTTLFIIISSSFICLTASSGTHTLAHSHTHALRLTHTLFPPGLASRTTLLIQRKEGQLSPGPSIIHIPENIDCSV